MSAKRTSRTAVADDFAERAFATALCHGSLGVDLAEQNHDGKISDVEFLVMLHILRGKGLCK